MSVFVHGSASGAAIGQRGDAHTFLYRYELVGAVLLRRRVAERRARSGRELRLVDVLVEDGARGRRISLVRGIVLREGDLARLDGIPGSVPWRDFPVGADLRRAIADDLGIAPDGGRLRLASVDGVLVG